MKTVSHVLRADLFGRLENLPMNLPVLLIVIFSSSLILTMIGLGGGLIFSPLFVLLGLSKSMVASTFLFLNGIAAASAAIVYYRKKMVDFSVSLPLIVTSSLGAPLGALLTYRVNLKLFVGIMAAVIFLAALRMLFSLTGFIAHAYISTIDWRFVLPAAACSFAGGQIGPRIMAEKLRGRTIRIMFGVVLLTLSSKLFHRALM